MAQLLILMVAVMSDKVIAIIGAGIFGCKIALALAEQNKYNILLFERKDGIMEGCSKNNQNRAHKGFHYPRDLKTAQQCQLGFKRFVDEFPECIANDFPNAYFIASRDSLTSPEAYIKFCKDANLEYEIIDAKNHAYVRGCDLGILCKEVIYDCEILKTILVKKILNKSQINLFCGTEILAIKKTDNGYNIETSDYSYKADIVINCCYSEINRFTQELGFDVVKQQYEYTAIPIIELDMPKQGITIVDGQFMTLLPHGKSNNFLLYHVKHSVIDKQVGITHDQDWNDKNTSPFAKIDHDAFFKKIVEDCTGFVPVLAHAKLVGFLQSPRMVLANRDKDDARPSIITNYGNNYYTIFAGKIDHCIWVADEIVNII